MFFDSFCCLSFLDRSHPFLSCSLLLIFSSSLFFLCGSSSGFSSSSVQIHFLCSHLFWYYPLISHFLLSYSNVVSCLLSAHPGSPGAFFCISSSFSSVSSPSLYSLFHISPSFADLSVQFISYPFPYCPALLPYHHLFSPVLLSVPPPFPFPSPPVYCPSFISPSSLAHSLTFFLSLSNPTRPSPSNIGPPLLSMHLLLLSFICPLS